LNQNIFLAKTVLLFDLSTQLFQSILKNNKILSKFYPNRFQNIEYLHKQKNIPALKSNHFRFKFKAVLFYLKYGLVCFD